VPGVARYSVRDGREIIVDPRPGAPAGDIRLSLLGTALGTLCYQRGLQPFHANAIEIDGLGVVFAGPSGTGKSTLAAHFAKRGHRVLCDDLCVLSVDPAGAVLVWPGLRQFKLWKDALLHLGYQEAGLVRAIDGRDKYHLPNSIADSGCPVPLRRLYLLDRA